MDISQRKLDLINFIINTQNDKALQSMEKSVQETREDSEHTLDFEKLPEKVKQSVQKSRQELANGERYTLEKVKERLRNL